MVQPKNYPPSITRGCASLSSPRLRLFASPRHDLKGEPLRFQGRHNNAAVRKLHIPFLLLALDGNIPSATIAIISSHCIASHLPVKWPGGGNTERVPFFKNFLATALSLGGGS